MTLKKISHIKTPLKNMLTAGLIPITSCALPSDSKFQRTRIRSHHSLYRTSHRVTHSIFKQQLGLLLLVWVQNNEEECFQEETIGPRYIDFL